MSRMALRGVFQLEELPEHGQVGGLAELPGPADKDQLFATLDDAAYEQALIY